MANSLAQRWLPRVTAAVLWAAAALSAVAWALRLPSAPGVDAADAAAATTAAAALDPVALGRLLGAAAAPAQSPAAAPALASRFVLAGVVATRSGEGAALIAVDGKPPRPFRVGAVVDEGLVLQSVAPRRAALAARGDAQPLLTLEMPLPPRAGS